MILFIEKSFNKGFRNVQVITGKGKNGKGKSGSSKKEKQNKRTGLSEEDKKLIASLQPNKQIIVREWRENEEIMKAFNSLVEMCGPVFENLDAKGRKAAEKRLPSSLDMALYKLDSILMKLCDNKLPSSLIDELTKHIPYKSQMVRKQMKRLRLREKTNRSKEISMKKLEIFESKMKEIFSSPETRENHAGMLWHIKADMDAKESAEISWTDHFTEFYTTKIGVQQGLWGQWIQAPGAHPYGPGGGTIEGGYGVYEKFGRSKYPTYMASGANKFYNANSTYSGWGFYERRCDCADFGGVQLTNKVLNLPNAIHFDEDQDEHAEDGGIYFGHGWFALPIFSGEERPESFLLDDHSDRGKLTWTFVSNSAQYSGPMWAYVPEYWIRHIDINNAFTLLEDGSEDNEDLLGEELRKILIEYIAGRYENKALNEYIKGLDWYVDNANYYDYEMETPLFWTEEKNTLAYRSTNHVAIGAEMYELPIFTEYDDNGDLYIKIFPTMAPSLKDKEFFTLDARSYDVGVYNNFVEFFNGDSEIEDVNTNIKQYSTPLIVEKHDRNPSTINLKQGELFSIDERLVKWNLYLQGETKNGETNTFWDWSGTSPNERDLSQYYKVLMPGGVSDYSSYKFTPVNENQVPAELKVMEMNTLERGNSYMPHIKSNSDKLWEEEIKNNTDNAFNIDSIPYDYSCFDCDNGGCDTTVYETTLDDGSMIKYRWYRFRDQPTFKYLSIDYPEIYTEEYLDFLQLKIEKMHKEWGHNQEFISTPNSLKNFHLVELDNGMVVEPPSGKEFGWVPIVTEVEIPYGKYVTDRNYYDLSCGTFPGDPSCNLNDINGQEGRKMIATDGAYRVSTP